MSVGESSGSGDLCKSSTSGSLNSNNQNGSNSDISCQEDEDMIDDDDADMIDDDDADEDADYAFSYNDDIYEDNYSSMQDHFDNVDLPPGVEASLPWLKDISSSDVKQAVTFPRAESSSKGKVDEIDDMVVQKFQQFKQFDTVDSFPEHHYDKEGTSESQVINIVKYFWAIGCIYRTYIFIVMN